VTTSVATTSATGVTVSTGRTSVATASMASAGRIVAAGSGDS
jgi:hypothetical protein